MKTVVKSKYYASPFIDKKPNVYHTIIDYIHNNVNVLLTYYFT